MGRSTMNRAEGGGFCKREKDSLVNSLVRKE